jgi:cystathionine beta-lyase/cystathionine gamma-synthase
MQLKKDTSRPCQRTADFVTMNGQCSYQRVQPQQGLSPATLAAHAGRPRKPFLVDQSSTSQAGNPHVIPQNAHVTPLFQTSVFDFDSISSGLEQVVGQGAYGYGRMGLPNAHELGSAIAALEGAETGVATSSGKDLETAGRIACFRRASVA